MNGGSTEDERRIRFDGYRKGLYIRHMARIINNDLTESLSGKIGRKLVYKTYAYGTIATRYPDMSKVKFSPKQKKSNKLFTDAVAFAKAVIADPAKRKKYEAKLAPGKTVYHTALSEYMKKNRL